MYDSNKNQNKNAGGGSCNDSAGDDTELYSNR